MRGRFNPGHGAYSGRERAQVEESLRTRVMALAARMREARTREALAALIAEEVATYTLHDLQRLRASVERDLRHVPPHYRSRLEPKMMEHLFGTHHTIILRLRRDGFGDLRGPVEGKLLEFCEMLVALPGREEEREIRLVLLYYLIAAFTIFVRGLPGHPVGTPFPGGFRVEVRDGVYYCPVREKANDVETSICPYCPARQSESP
jgi:uncharacterized protein (UPF0305 family)